MEICIGERGADKVRMQQGDLSTIKQEETISSSELPGGFSPDSYFPAWDKYSAQKVITPGVIELRPLLPTPESAVLPLPELTLDSEEEDDESVETPPTCSCPTKETCAVECLALLVGSAALLSMTVEYFSGNLDLSNGTRQQDARRTPTPISPKEISRLEPTLRKLIGPIVHGKVFDVAEVLHRWRSPGTSANPDLCGRLRERLRRMGIDLVDTFAPLQYDVHKYLALVDYDDDALQSKIEAVPTHQVSAKVKLLLKANSQLIVFSVKDVLLSLEELQIDLQDRIDDLAVHVELSDLGLC